jgi:hypothetical protein
VTDLGQDSVTLDPDDRWDLESGAPSFVRRAFAWLDGGLEATGTD